MLSNYAALFHLPKKSFFKKKLKKPQKQKALTVFWHNTEDLQDLQVQLHERKTGGNRRPSRSERDSLLWLCLYQRFQPIQTKFYFKGQIQHQIIKKKLQSQTLTQTGIKSFQLFLQCNKPNLQIENRPFNWQALRVSLRLLCPGSVHEVPITHIFIKCLHY